MSKGIVRVTPKATSPGNLDITQADPNPYHVVYGTNLLFDYPGFDVKVGDNVKCNILSATTCKVIS
jgi:hypothetical protein